MEKLLILRLGQKIYKMSLEHLTVPEIKEVLKKKKRHYDWVFQRATGPRAKENNLSNRIDKQHWILIPKIK